MKRFNGRSLFRLSERICKVPCPFVHFPNRNKMKRNDHQVFKLYLYFGTNGRGTFKKMETKGNAMSFYNVLSRVPFQIPFFANWRH